MSFLWPSEVCKEFIAQSVIINYIYNRNITDRDCVEENGLDNSVDCRLAPVSPSFF
jgi:hypothetical protein